LEPAGFRAGTEPVHKACVWSGVDPGQEVNAGFPPFDSEMLAGLDVVNAAQFGWEDELTFGRDDGLHGGKMRVLRRRVKGTSGLEIAGSEGMALLETL